MSREPYSTQEFIEKAQKIHGDEYDYSKVVYQGYLIKIEIVCKQHGPWWQTAQGHLRGYGCSSCKNKRINVSKRNLPRTRPGNRLKGEQRGKGFKPLPSSEELIRRITTAHPSIEVIGVPTSTLVRVALHCKICGHNWEAMPVNLASAKGEPKFGCPGCKKSKGEDAVALFLINLSLAYTTQKKFDSCKNKKALPFDFYIPSLNVLIEYQGEQHFRPTRRRNALFKFQQVQHNDSIKRNWAALNGFELIEVKYTDDIKEFLSVRLTKVNTTAVI